MLENQEESHFVLRRTDDVGERVGVLFVRERHFRHGTPSTKGMKLRDFLPGVQKGDADTRGCMDYLLTGTAEAPQGYLGFTFAAPKSATAEPVPYDIETNVVEKEWPDWMRALYAIEDPDVPYEIVTAGGSTFRGRVFDRVEFYDGGFYSTEVKIEKFLSPLPTPIELRQSITPVPTRVHWNFMGAGNSLSCLHPKVIIPEQHPNGRLVPGFGTPNARERRVAGDVFPQTNLPGWQTHVRRDDEKLVGGVYYRERETWTPMYIPPPTYR